MPLPSHLEDEAAHAESMPWWKRLSALLVVGALWLASLLLFIYFAAREFVDNEASHDGEKLSWWEALKDSDFWDTWNSRMWENIQSENYQTFIVFFLGALTYLIFKKWGGSSESKDSEERIEAKIDEIREHLGLK